MIGKLAASCGFNLPVQVMQSAAGYYLGTTESGLPMTRESAEYWATSQEASGALESGNWTQKGGL